MLFFTEKKNPNMNGNLYLSRSAQSRLLLKNNCFVIDNVQKFRELSIKLFIFSQFCFAGQKKKQLRLLGATLTPESIVESANPKKKEFNFPRTPKSAFKGKRRKEKESFMNGLHRRLGINSET